MLINNQFVRSKRLNCSEDFKQTFQQGIKLRQTYFMIYTKRNGLGYPRLGLDIPKKVVPKAVSRNWIKRTIRESFRLNQKLLPDLDIIVKVTSQRLSSNQLFRCDLDKQWSSLLTYYKKA